MPDSRNELIQAAKELTNPMTNQDALATGVALLGLSINNAAHHIAVAIKEAAIILGNSIGNQVRR
jgi:hypothetical protein